MSLNTDKYFLEKLKEGDERAFRKIYDRYHQSIYGIAFKYLKSKSLAEDAVHDVFIKLWDYRNKLDANQSLKGFLFTTAKNHVLNMIRNKKRNQEKREGYAHLKPVSKNKTVDHLTLKNYKKVFQHFLKKLPEGKREIFRMKMQEGISNKKIAEKLEISVNTVKSQYYKASKFIKEQLNKHTEISIE